MTAEARRPPVISAGLCAQTRVVPSDGASTLPGVHTRLGPSCDSPSSSQLDLSRQTRALPPRRPPPLQRRLAAAGPVPRRPHQRDLPNASELVTPPTRTSPGPASFPREQPRLRRNHPLPRIRPPLLLPLPLRSPARHATPLKRTPRRLESRSSTASARQQHGCCSARGKIPGQAVHDDHHCVDIRGPWVLDGVCCGCQQSDGECSSRQLQQQQQ